MHNRIDTSSEFIITPHAGGIKLVRPDHASFKRASKVVGQRVSVADAMRLPYNMFFLDADHKIKITTDYLWQLSGFISREDAIDNTISSICNNKRHVEKIFKNDKQVMCSKQFNTFNEQLDAANDTNINALCVKLPWFDDNEKVLGIFGCSIILTNDTMNDIPNYFTFVMNMLFQKNDILQQRKEKIFNNTFTPRETDILRLIVRGKTIRQIALMLGLSNRTIENYYATIKMKACVNSKSDLIDMLIDDYL